MSDTSIATHATNQGTRTRLSSNVSYGFKTLPTVEERSLMNVKSSLRRSRSEMYTKAISELNICNSLLTHTMPMGKDWTAFKITAFVKSVTLTLISDLNSIGCESTEIANLSCDDIVVTATQTEVSNILDISYTQYT